MIIRRKAYPRAALVGNPSDGYYGKTISLAFTQFEAEVTLFETPEVEIQANTRDHSVFGSIGALVDDVRLFGYYGGIRLLKATVKRFYEYCNRRGIALHDRNFTIRYRSNIPHLVGLAGSSAIITACSRALKAFYGVTVPKAEEANLVLSVETDELQISAGLQDRVAQVYQGLVYMDFEREFMERHGHGRYEQMDPAVLPRLYIAYRSDLSQGSEVFHNDFRERFRRRDPEVIDAIAYWGELTDQVRNLLSAGRGSEIGPLLNDNFDRRASVCRISEGNLKMVEAARSAGATAKFTGSGGAIIGTYEDESMLSALTVALDRLNVKVLRPTVAPASEEGNR